MILKCLYVINFFETVYKYTFFFNIDKKRVLLCRIFIAYPIGKVKKNRDKTAPKVIRKPVRTWKALSLGGKIWRVVWVVLLIGFVISLFQVLLYKYFNPPFTPLMIKRYVQQKKDPNREVRYLRQDVSIDDISMNLIDIVNQSENYGLFLYDHGFLHKALSEAVLLNEKSHRIVWGGSVITQQTAKNCFTFHSKNYFRKAMESYYAILINALWTKKRVMECYLNLVEFGDGIYGCEAASQYYFHHSANTLDKNESLMLASTMISPLHGTPFHQDSIYTRRYQMLTRLMQDNEPIIWDDEFVKDPDKVDEGSRGLLFFLKWVTKRKVKQILY